MEITGAKVRSTCIYKRSRVCQQVRFYRNLILWSSTTSQKKIHSHDIVAKALADAAL